MSRLLLDDKPLIVLPSLAKEIGLNESIVLQQLHYWLMDSRNIKDGYKWVYNTYEDWQKQFPFWSVSTIRRTITKLETIELIIIGNYNKLKIDNTKWYRIDYEKLKHVSRPSVQNEQTECSNWTDGVVKMNRPLPENTTENTTETNNKNIYSNEFEQFWSIYPRKNDKKKAFKSFKTTIKNHSLETILSGTKKYALQTKNTDKQYIKLPSTFLNNDSFIDGYEEGGNQSGQPKTDYLDNLF